MRARSLYRSHSFCMDEKYADVDLPEFLELVDDDVQMTRRGKLHQRAEDILEAFGRAEHHVAQLLIDLTGERLAKILLALPLDKKVNIRLAVKGLHDERSLADPPAPRHHGELRDFLAAFADFSQVRKLTLSVEKPHSLIAFFL